MRRKNKHSTRTNRAPVGLPSQPWMMRVELDAGMDDLTRVRVRLTDHMISEAGVLGVFNNTYRDSHMWVDPKIHDDAPYPFAVGGRVSITDFRNMWSLKYPIIEIVPYAGVQLWAKWANDEENKDRPDGWAVTGETLLEPENIGAYLQRANLCAIPPEQQPLWDEWVQNQGDYLCVGREIPHYNGKTKLYWKEIGI